MPSTAFETIEQPLVIELDDELYERLCIIASKAGRTPGDYVGDLIEAWARRQAPVEEGKAE